MKMRCPHNCSYKDFVYRCRRAMTNAVRFRNQSVIYAVIAFVGAYLLLFSTLLFSCASVLLQMTNIPYLEYYLFYCTDKFSENTEYDKTTIIYGDYALSALEMFEVVEDAFGTTQYTVKINLKYITTQGTCSSSYGSFLWTVIPNTALDDSFRLGERLLIKGRHLTMEDYRAKKRYIMMDEVLAKVNKLNVGDLLDTGDGIPYEVIGLYRTMKVEKHTGTYEDIPQNLLLASSPPSSGEKSNIGTRDVYFKFRKEVSENDREEFLNYLGELGITGEDRFDKYEFISVKTLNEINQTGVTTVYRIAWMSVICIFVILVSANYLFIHQILQNRYKEILVYKALGEKRWYIWFTFLLEGIYVQIPSMLIGILGCLFLGKEKINQLFMHFSRKMTPENLCATSSASLEVEERASKLLTEFSTIQNLPSITIGIFIVLLCITCISVTTQLFAILNAKEITLLTEQKQ